jgi:hypothetical protein
MHLRDYQGFISKCAGQRAGETGTWKDKPSSQGEDNRTLRLRIAEWVGRSAREVLEHKGVLRYHLFMQWINQQRIFSPSPTHRFCKTRVMAPTPWRKSDDVIRLFCGFCDAQGISRPGYVDVCARDPAQVLRVSDRPLMDLGEAGDFDDNGLCPTSILALPGGILRMYYFGFQCLHKVPFAMFSGLAESRDGGESFTRLQRTPVLDRTKDEPVMRSGPCVLLEGGIYKIWYPCGRRWIEVNGKQVHEYDLHYAESEDGILWPSGGRMVVDIVPPDEFGLGRPYVLRNAEGYLLFYSVRTRSLGYRLGYASSGDGIAWTRRDEAMGMKVSLSSWDSQMQCYGAVLEVENRVYLFYNGNDLGGTGFGYAEAADFASAY